MKRFKKIEALLGGIVELANEKDDKKITKRATGICKKSTDLQFAYMPDSPIWGLINSHGKVNKQLRIEAQEYALKMQDNIKWLFQDIAKNALEHGEDFEAYLTDNIGDKDKGSVFEWVFQDEPDDANGIIRLASFLMLFTGTKGVGQCQVCNDFFLITTRHKKTLCGSRCKQQMYRNRELAKKEERINKKREEFFSKNTNGDN